MNQATAAFFCTDNNITPNLNNARLLNIRCCREDKKD